jgi:hypothetical protein
VTLRAPPVILAGMSDASRHKPQRRPKTAKKHQEALRMLVRVLGRQAARNLLRRKDTIGTEMDAMAPARRHTSQEDEPSQ